METETWTKPKRFPAQQQQQQLKIVVQEKRQKREGKYRLVFLFFFSLFVFVLFGVDEREGEVLNRLEGELCWNFTVVFALWLPQGMAGERGVEGEGGLCVRIASTFGANFRLMKSARHDAARQKPWGQLC